MAVLLGVRRSQRGRKSQSIALTAPKLLPSLLCGTNTEFLSRLLASLLLAKSCDKCPLKPLTPTLCLFSLCCSSLAWSFWKNPSPLLLSPPPSHTPTIKVPRNWVSP